MARFDISTEFHMHMQGMFWYHFEAWRVVDMSTYERVPSRDFDAKGPGVWETLGMVGVCKFNTPTVVDEKNAAVFPGGGMMYVLQTWLPLPLVGVSLN